MRLDGQAILTALGAVKDPEIPVVSVVELGIVQDVRVHHSADGSTVEVDITPTFSGCPALERMREDIALAVRALGADQVTVKVVLDPPWTSDRILPQARERMRSLGLEPPPLRGTSRFSADLELSPLVGSGTGRPDPTSKAVGPAPAALWPPDPEAVACPYCGSLKTRLQGTFGTTLCRTLHYCDTCRQGFEAFKPI